jgi:hypothetical protein
MKTVSMYIRLGTERGNILNSVTLSLVVGSLLNVINQWDLLIGGALSGLPAIQVILTYLVPLLVSDFASVSAQLRFRQNTPSSVSADIKCSSCKGTHRHVNKYELVPSCPVCNDNTRWKPVKLYP